VRYVRESDTPYTAFGSTGSNQKTHAPHVADEAKRRGSSALENTMTVQITPKSIQHTGMATSMEGSVAAWQVTFELDGDDSLHAAISIPLAGPPTHHEAQQKALKILQVFLNDACEAAKKYQFSN
jgi:hypothetical protein